MEVTAKRTAVVNGIPTTWWWGPFDSNALESGLRDELEKLLADVNFFDLPSELAGELTEYSYEIMIKGDRTHTVRWFDGSQVSGRFGDFWASLQSFSEAANRAPEESPEPIFRYWRHVPDEDTEDVEVYHHHVGWPAPGFTIAPSGEFFRITGVSALDMPVGIRGRWKAERLRVLLTEVVSAGLDNAPPPVASPAARVPDTAPEEMVLEIVSYDEETLKIRKQRRTY